jgi:hypothetical protein
MGDCQTREWCEIAARLWRPCTRPGALRQLKHARVRWSYGLNLVVRDGVERALQFRVPALLVEGATDMVVLGIASDIDPGVFVVDARGEVASFIGVLAGDDRGEDCSLGFVDQTDGVEHAAGELIIRWVGFAMRVLKYII